MTTLPPLGFDITVAGVDGSNAVTHSESATDHRFRASVKSFSSKLNTGFESATVNLDRDMRQTYANPRLLQEMKIRGNGKSAWEGRVTKVPVARNDDLQGTGWWDGTKDTVSVDEIYADTDTSHWGEPPVTEKTRIGAANVDFGSFSWSSDGGSLVCALPNQALGAQVLSSMWYTAPPGALVAKIGYTGTDTGLPVGWDGPQFRFDSDASSSDETQLATFDSTARTVTATTPARYVWVYMWSNGTASTPAAGANRKISSVTVYGNHGLTNIYASEVIKHAIGKYCPLLSATSATIDDTTYAIGQLMFDGDTVADVVQRCNAFHLWRFAVWEDRKCYFSAQLDPNDFDFEIPHQGEFKGTLQPAGPELEDDEPCNGVWVYYTNAATGRRERVGPYGTSAPYDTAGDASLLVTSETNACNLEGQTRFPKLDISFACTRADAILMGSVWLAEKQYKVNSGSGTGVGYVKNRAGAYVPAWEIRAGHRVKYSHESVIREVYSTTYDVGSATNTLNFEKPDSTYEGIQERVTMRLDAAGISG